MTDAGMAHFKDCTGLTALNLNKTQVGDAGLSYFKECKDLTVLSLVGTPVTDAGLDHLKGLRALTRLEISRTGNNLSVLRGMPLKQLNCDFQPGRDAEILRSIKTLETINGQPAAEFWKKVESK